MPTQHIVVEVAPFTDTVDDLRHAIAATATAACTLGQQRKQVVAIGTKCVGSRLDIIIEFQPQLRIVEN